MENKQQEQITYPNLPLAVYRELAAHLRQVQEVTTELIPQLSKQFDYNQSQIDNLQICYPVNLSSKERQQIDAILDYYAQIHGACDRQFLES